LRKQSKSESEVKERERGIYIVGGDCKLAKQTTVTLTSPSMSDVLVLQPLPSHSGVRHGNGNDDASDFADVIVPRPASTLSRSLQNAESTALGQASAAAFVVVTMPPLPAVLPVLPRQASRAMSLVASPASRNGQGHAEGQEMTRALTREPFPLHCPWCNRTVVTEPRARRTRRTWLYAALLTPALMCLLPLWANWHCDVQHCCGRCRRVIAVFYANISRTTSAATASNANAFS
jgi:hypothetical protein